MAEDVVRETAFMADSDTPLIVGAGPTGLAAALFLRERGIPARIIDADDAPSVHSKALAVNARTLDLLEPAGVTDKMLAAGRAAKAFHLWRPDRKLATIPFGGEPDRFPFMLILAQSESERLLADAVTQRGLTVERGVSLTDVSTSGGRITATLSTGETLSPPYLLGADGAHSTVRKTLKRDFPGSSWPESWHLYDVHLKTPLDDASAHAFLLDEGALFMLRIKADIWRVIGQPGGVLDRLPVGTTTGEIVWESEFEFSHRIAKPLCADNVCLAGDAAHIHAPIGGRGMNLGIEDAYVFAALAAENRLNDYERLRRPAIESVVHMIEKMGQVPRGKSLAATLVRKFSGVVPWIVSREKTWLRNWLLGLDHEVGVE